MYILYNLFKSNIVKKKFWRSTAMSLYTCTDDITNQGNFTESSIIKLYDITKRSSSFQAFHIYMLSTLYKSFSFSLARHNTLALLRVFPLSIFKCIFIYKKKPSKTFKIRNKHREKL